MIALYCLKLKLGATYRELSDWLAEMPDIRQALGLKRLPHFTTVQKAFRTHDTRIGLKLTERNLERFEALAADKGYDDQTHRSKLRAWGKASPDQASGVAPSDKAANACMNEKLSPQRSLVETVISVLKRKYGDAVSSRVW